MDDAENLLENIGSKLTPPPLDDPLARAEATSYDLAAQRELAELESFRQDIQARKEYAGKIYRLIAVWLGAIYVVIILQGLCAAFTLSDTVLVTLISGTTINVLGLFIVVVNYLFSRGASADGSAR